MITAVLFLLSSLVAVGAIPIDNGLAGEPEIQCGPTSVQLSFATQRSFVGVAYAKNLHDQPGCAVRGDSSSGGGIEMEFDSCNVKRTRSADPKGIFVTATVVIQFHPSVLTKVDRAFHIRCFYMEADKTVDQQLEVSMITTELRTMNVPMPVCRYDILEGQTGAGQPIRFVKIGDKIFHKWTCDTETVDTFCMVVYGCYVDDGSGSLESRIELVDDEGCGIDRNLLETPEYPTNLMAGTPAHVFKYADRPQVYFNCQIRINVKEPDVPCLRPANCQAQESLGRRKRRQADGSSERGDFGVMDIAPQYPLYIADVELVEDESSGSLSAPAKNYPSSGGLCVSQGFAGVVLTGLSFSGVAAIAMTIVLLLRRK